MTCTLNTSTRTQQFIVGIALKFHFILTCGWLIVWLLYSLFFSPSVGFLEQLQLYEAMGSTVDKTHPAYKQYRLQLLASQIQSKSVMKYFNLLFQILDCEYLPSFLISKTFSYRLAQGNLVEKSFKAELHCYLFSSPIFNIHQNNFYEWLFLKCIQMIN